MWGRLAPFTLAGNGGWDALAPSVTPALSGVTSQLQLCTGCHLPSGPRKEGHFASISNHPSQRGAEWQSPGVPPMANDSNTDSGNSSSGDLHADAPTAWPMHQQHGRRPPGGLWWAGCHYTLQLVSGYQRVHVEKTS